jgi:hypothetical protein
VAGMEEEVVATAGAGAGWFLWFLMWLASFVVLGLGLGCFLVWLWLAILLLFARL